MILTLLGIAAGMIIGGAAVYFWDEIQDWVNSIWRSVSALVAELFLVRLAYRVMKKLYTQDRSGQWRTHTQEVSESELPAELRDRIREKDREYQIATYR